MLQSLDILLLLDSVFIIRLRFNIRIRLNIILSIIRLLTQNFSYVLELIGYKDYL